jgi:hypothetical protein
MWDSVDETRIRLCIENKDEYDRVFPKLIILIGQRVKEKLGAKFPDMHEWVGPYAREKTKLLHPDMQEPFYLDWVCFGFEGYPSEDAHIGVLFDLNHWPVTYRIGVHVLDYIWQPKEENIINKRKKMTDKDYIYEYQPAFKEHQLNDPQKVLDFSNINAGINNIVNRVEELYCLFNPLIKHK